MTEQSESDKVESGLVVNIAKSLWVSVGLCGSLWVSVGLCKSLWVSVGLCGSLDSPMSNLRK